MKFGQPEWLQLFWILPGIAVFALYRFYCKRHMRRRMGRLEKLSQISRIPKLSRELTHSVCLLLTLGLTIAALTLPRLERLSYEPFYRGLDMVFLLDTSPSMAANDILPSRMEKAREIIIDFLLRKEDDDRAALVGFSESSMIYSYLTSDSDPLLFYFDFLEIGQESLYGTNMGAAIRSGLAVVARERNLFPDRPSNRTVLILLSDGDDHGGEVPEAIEMARQEGIHVYTIGIGSRQGAYIPVRVRGQLQYLVDERGTRLRSVLHEETLKTIASSTGARHYRASSGEEIKLALSHLLAQERAVQGYRQKVVLWELYPYLLVAAFLFSLGLIVL